MTKIRILKASFDPSPQLGFEFFFSESVFFDSVLINMQEHWRHGLLPFINREKLVFVLFEVKVWPIVTFLKKISYIFLNSWGDPTGVSFTTFESKKISARQVENRISHPTLRGYSTVFEILDRGSEGNETSYRNSENSIMKIYPFAPDQK
jgi:hypothetical protein